MLVGDEAVHRGGHCDGNYGAMVHLRWLANTWPVPYGILRSSQLRPLLTPDGKPSRLDLLLPNRDPSRLFPVVRLRRTHDSRPGAAHTFTRFIERRLFAAFMLDHRDCRFLYSGGYEASQLRVACLSCG